LCGVALDEAAEDSETEAAYEAPTSMDGETLTRTDNGGIMLLGGGGTMGKSTCVTFAAYQSSRWKCHRYEVDGSHSYGHYFYTSEIAYHTIDGVDSFCIEPNTSSLGGQYYSSYTAEEASSSSYWKLELDDLQRSHIQKILAFGYPQVDYGYSRQVQYAATQILIWEVVSHSRVNADIKSCADYGLYSKVYAVLGADFQSCYDGILNAISMSDGTVPSFAGASQSVVTPITLTLNNTTNCYEGSVRDNNRVLSHFTFSASGVNISRSGNTLYISVPAANSDAVKGQSITGTSDQKLMSTSNPTIWENPTYQTVLTSGGAEYLHAYISLTWEDAPKTGSLVVSKAVNYGSWSGFTFRLHGTSDKGNPVDVTATTGSDGKAYFKDIEIGTYTLEEVSPGNAYILPEPQTVTIPGNDIAYATVENVWKHWRAAITKVDADTGTASPQGDANLNGAEYTLYKSGKAVATYTVSNGGFTTDLFPCMKKQLLYCTAGFTRDQQCLSSQHFSMYKQRENRGIQSRTKCLCFNETTAYLFLPFLDGADGTQLIAGAALNALILIDLILFVPGINTAQRAVPEAAAACNAFLIDDIHEKSLPLMVQILCDIGSGKASGKQGKAQCRPVQGVVTPLRAGGHNACGIQSGDGVVIRI